MTLVAGREVVAHGLPSHEALTVLAGGSAVDRPAVVGPDRLLRGRSVGGIRLVVLLGVLSVVAAFASAVVASRLRGASARNTLFATTAAILVAPWGWQLRAQSFALPLFVWVLALVSLDPAFKRRRTLARLSTADPLGQPARIGHPRGRDRVPGGRRLARPDPSPHVASPSAPRRTAAAPRRSVGVRARVAVRARPARLLPPAALRQPGVEGDRRVAGAEAERLSPRLLRRRGCVGDPGRLAVAAPVALRPRRARR